MTDSGRLRRGRGRHDRGKRQPIHPVSREGLPVVCVMAPETVEFADAEYAAAIQALAVLIGEWSLPETARRTAA